MQVVTSVVYKTTFINSLITDNQTLYKIISLRRKSKEKFFNTGAAANKALSLKSTLEK